MPRWLYLVPVLVFVALVGYFAAGLTRDPHLVPSVLIGRPVPAFTLPPLPGLGAGLDSAALATGRPQLLNVFASWCAPCRAEQPVLLHLARAGVSVRGLNYKDRPEDAVAWLDRYGNPFTSIGADPEGRVAIDFGGALRHAEVPVHIRVPEKALAVSGIALCMRYFPHDQPLRGSQPPPDGIPTLPFELAPLVSKGIEFTPTGKTHFTKKDPLAAYFEVYEPLLAG